jgi:uncharacterized integral membrane protein (TIGR00698 family)
MMESPAETVADARCDEDRRLLPATVAKYAPGLLLAFGAAAAAWALHALPGLSRVSPAILAILLGLAARRVIGPSAAVLPGLAFSVRTLLRLAVVLLGLQVTVQELATLGLGGLASVIAALAVCFVGTAVLGAWMGVERRLARLIGIGTAVCGASAVVAGNSVMQGDDEDVAYALAAVTVFGSIAMVGMPFLAELLHLTPASRGLWLGASIHEVAQVVGAATQLGDETVRIATITKMARILMLAPLVLLMAVVEGRRGGGQAKVPVPWFVFGFVALAALASSGAVPAAIIKPAATVSAFLLAAALAAMGFGIDVRALRRKGLKPLLLALSSWLLIASVSLALVG